MLYYFLYILSLLSLVFKYIYECMDYVEVYDCLYLLILSLYMAEMSVSINVRYKCIDCLDGIFRYSRAHSKSKTDATVN